ncbi:MAG: BlaI/MecI/CopY family transcriptional regulator [Candidatus Latescibacterota bacterium]|nr:MAG: BlaI/MecI/CopY family transcriptional regulator [Candidatus Latescibacterota bacterium]
MDIIYRLGQATVSEVLENLENPPSYSAVRAHLRILEEKGLLRHRQNGAKYVYHPRVSREKARRSALKGMLLNFFDGSREQMIAALLDAPGSELSEEELERLAKMIEKAKEEGR